MLKAQLLKKIVISNINSGKLEKTTLINLDKPNKKIHRHCLIANGHP
jgi:hypothetical protein